MPPHSSRELRENARLPAATGEKACDEMVGERKGKVRQVARGGRAGSGCVVFSFPARSGAGQKRHNIAAPPRRSEREGMRSHEAGME